MVEELQKPQTQLMGKLKLSADLKPFLTDSRIKLLEGIDQLGSLSASARALPMSYKAAWDAMDTMNNLSDRPLVNRFTGGKNGGGSKLTPYGKKLVGIYRALEFEYQNCLDKVQDLAPEDVELDDIESIRDLVKRIKFRASARNRFIGTISKVTLNPNYAIASLEISEGVALRALVTLDAVEELELCSGLKMMAMIKSSKLVLDDLNNENLLSGKVSRLEKGTGDMAELTVDLNDQKTLTILIQKSQVSNYVINQQVSVAVPASDIVLVRYD